MATATESQNKDSSLIWEIIGLIILFFFVKGCLFSSCNSTSNKCIYCNGTGKLDCIYCVNGVTSNGTFCTFCNGKGWNTCSFCNGTGKDPN